MSGKDVMALISPTIAKAMTASKAMTITAMINPVRMFAFARRIYSSSSCLFFFIVPHLRQHYFISYKNIVNKLSVNIDKGADCAIITTHVAQRMLHKKE